MLTYTASYTHEGQNLATTLMQAWSEFGLPQGTRCLLIILKALYSLWTSGARWHETFANNLLQLGFRPMRADPNMWIHGRARRDVQVHCHLVDDVLVFSKRADDIMKDIQEIYKMKGGSGKARTLSASGATWPIFQVLPLAMYTSAENISQPC